MKTQSAKCQEMSQVSTQLNTGVELFQRLSDILIDERSNLEKRDHASFKAGTVIKEECLFQIKHHEKEFNELLESLQLELGNKTIDSLIDRYDPDQTTPFTESALQYRSLLSQCDDLNTINGRLIQRSQVDANRLLDLLKGGGKQSQTYTRKGKTQTNGGKQPIAKA